MSIKCALCSLPCANSPPALDELKFCCTGCLTVYQILEKQGYHVKEESSPLKPLEGETHLLHLEVGGMWCPGCADAIEWVFQRMVGIKKCWVDYTCDLAKIEFYPTHLSKADIFQKFDALGYRASTLFAQAPRSSRLMWIRFIVTTFCTLNLMMLAYPLYLEHFGFSTEGYETTVGWLSFALAVPLITYGAWPFWKRFKLSLQTGVFRMETLVLMGVSTAFLYSGIELLQGHYTAIYFDTMGMLLTFVLLGNLLQQRAKFSAKESLARLVRRLPQKGLKEVASGEYQMVPLKEIKIGDTILARTGEKIVLDGEISVGEGWVDASVMSGEATPSHVKVGSSVIGGSLVKQGALHIRITAEAESSVLATLCRLIEGEWSRKLVERSPLDRLLRVFIPFVIGIALLGGLLGGVERALTVMLISCPCAIGIAAPLVEARMLELFAKRGAALRNRGALAPLANNPLFVFDKTGTLTEGKFQLLEGLDDLPLEHHALLKGLASQSVHPVATALSEALLGSTVLLDHVEEVIGRGMRAYYRGSELLLGSHTFFQERGFDCKEGVGTTVHFSYEGRLTTFQLGDKLRSDIPRVDGVILSGDTPALVEAIAEQLQFRSGKGGLSPLQKKEEIEKLPKPVVMVGDGVNDALALSAADVGISVVSATDLSIEVSDILLTKDSLEALPELVEIAKRGKRLILQNLIASFGYNSLALLLALSGGLTPLIAVLAMFLSSLFVTLNSMRLTLLNTTKHYSGKF